MFSEHSCFEYWFKSQIPCIISHSFTLTLSSKVSGEMFCLLKEELF